MPAINRFLLAALLAFAMPALASAQSYTLNRFHASESPDDAFHVSRPDAMGHLNLGVQLHLDYANDPLVYELDLGDRDSEVSRVVAHQLTGTLGLALGIADRAVLFAGLPVNLWMDGDDDTFGAPGADGSGLGDAYLGARVRILGERDDIVGLGAQATLTFPSGGGAYRGDDFISFHPEVLFEVRPEWFRLTLNVGFLLRDNQEYNDRLVAGDELTWALGATVPVVGSHRKPWQDRVDLHGQIYGATATADFGDRETSPIEALGGVKFHHHAGLVAGVAAGGGFQRGIGSPDFRVVLNLGWRTPFEEPTAAEPVARDTDGDGILDSEDACPRDPEDRDEFQDDDGCPDLDNDQDGVLDVDDRCPLEPGVPENDGCPDPDSDGDGILDSVDECDDQPEDVDEFEDEDGCPDPDNDGDGVLDSADNCPMEAGPVANHGCPDSDRDGDGVVDRLDNCPDEPGPESNQGCRERQQVVIREDRLEILDKVYFATNRARIQRRSYQLLRNIAAVLTNHPEITRIRIEGHTDDRGNDDYNMRLSQSRADAVMAFLVNEGVTEERLVARGFGETRPIDSNDSSEGRASNRRVEFNLGDAPVEGVEQRDSGPDQETIDR